MSLAPFNVTESVFRESTLNTWSILRQQMKEKPLLKTPINLRQKCLWGYAQGRILISRTNVPLLLWKFSPECSHLQFHVQFFHSLASLEMISKWSRKLRAEKDYVSVMKALGRDSWGWKTLIFYFIFACLVLNFFLFSFSPEHLIHSPRLQFEWSCMSWLFEVFN